MKNRPAFDSVGDSIDPDVFPGSPLAYLGDDWVGGETVADATKVVGDPDADLTIGAPDGPDLFEDEDEEDDEPASPELIEFLGFNPDTADWDSV